jgi:hypothetical protein
MTEPMTDREQQIMRTAWELGHQAAETERDELWHEQAARHVGQGPTHADLEALRWGPGGRKRFGDRRPGDYLGRDAEARKTALRADLAAQMDDPEPEAG